MCGIVGIMDVAAARAIDRDLVSRMNETQHHRGPDEGGLHVEPGLGLGHRRLSIIDLSTGQQPLYNEDGSVVVVFNGEIYNYRELIPELTRLGHVFRTRSDTEVIVHAWEQWGEDCVTRFRGMFAFALWDRNRETLFLARDRLGVKPLYYALLPSGLLALRIRAQVAGRASGVRARARPVRGRGVLRARLRARAAHDLRGARASSRPAHTLTIRRGQPVPEPREYWDVRFTLDNPIGERDAEAELVERLRESVRLRMISEVPLGAFLSGGVDSSAVVAMMAGVSAEPVNTCSIAFGDPAFDESRFARQVADRYRTRHFVDTVESDDFDLIDVLAADLRRAVCRQLGAADLPRLPACAQARDRRAVRATAATRISPAIAATACTRWRSACAARCRSRSAVRPSGCWAACIRRPTGRRGCSARSRRSRRSRGPRSMPTSTASRSCGTTCATSCSATRSRRGSAAIRRPRSSAATALRAGTDDPLALVQYLDLKTYLVGDINTKVDRASMAHSLEVREPLMDHPLVEWLATPAVVAQGARPGRQVPAEEGDGAVSCRSEIMYRPKMGFAVPLARWFRGPLRQRVTDAVLGPRLAATGVVQSALPAAPRGRARRRRARLQLAALDAAHVRRVPAGT